VVAALFALTLGVAAEVWAGTQGFAQAPDAAGPACSSEGFAAAVRAQRPAVNVHVWYPDDASVRPPDSAVRARLTQHGSAVSLDIQGAGKAIARTLPEADGCERNVATAALIVDGALDDLKLAAAAPSVDSLAPPVPFWKQLHLGLAAGVGFEQGMFGVVPAFDVQVALRYRFVELTLDADLGLAGSTTFTANNKPEQNGEATLTANPFDFSLGAGVTPRLGPGRVSADVLVGIANTSVAPSSVTGGVLHPQTATTDLPFGGLRLGYSLDLWRGLFLTLRAEERLGPTAAFQVTGNGQVATTRAYTFQALGLLGVHFF
jgi:hypothetical protein